MEQELGAPCTRGPCGLCVPCLRLWYRGCSLCKMHRWLRVTWTRPIDYRQWLHCARPVSSLCRGLVG